MPVTTQPGDCQPNVVNPSDIKWISLLLRLNETFNPVFVLANGATPPEPLNFTGCTFNMQIRDQMKITANLLFTISSENSYVSYGEDPTAGLLYFNVPVSALSEIMWIKGFYDFKQIAADSSETVLFEGDIYTCQGVTV